MAFSPLSRSSLTGKEWVWILSGALLAGAAGVRLSKSLPIPARSPGVAALSKENPRTTALIEIRRKEARAKKKNFKPFQKWVPLHRISPLLVDAVLAAEDGRFFQHKGVEWELMKHAFWEEMKTRRKTRGASTITQQLAKNLYLSPTKSYWRKLRELLITYQLEKTLSKQRILEIYLNVAEWGDGVFGAEAAARRYFHKSAFDLTLDEAVSLAAVLPSPRRRSPLSSSRWIETRRRWVLKRMRQSGRLPSSPPPEVLDAPTPPLTIGNPSAPPPSSLESPKL
jgi:monofunctional biosynthetic peptidoglycan transglycosylase